MVFVAAAIVTCALAAQSSQPQQSPEKTLKIPGAKPEEDEPPEEDPSSKPQVYTLNPLEADRNITKGNFYFKKGNYRAAARDYLEATRWDPGSVVAFLKLAETDERMRDLAGAREAYTKYLELAPDSKNAAEIKKKIGKWPEPRAKK